jgi:uncharacterized SAM-binding protein YcdF (DUF218 family)
MVDRDGSLSGLAQERFLTAYQVLRAGRAPCLVITDDVLGSGPPTDAVRLQMKALGLDYPVEITGPVKNTHDEAVQVAQMARAKGWKQVILVTQPWHMPRARAVFAHEGLSVIRCPAEEPRYDMRALDDPEIRYAAFRDWLHEAIGIEVYRKRHWI